MERWGGCTVGEDGWFKGPSLRRGYFYASVDAERDKIMILEAAGHSQVLVNGVPRGGDV